MLVGFAAWTVLLLLATVGVYRWSRILTGRVAIREQVAKYLNVDKFTVYRLLADKELPAFKVGNQWRFKRKQLENWLLKNSNLSRKKSN